MQCQIIAVIGQVILALCTEVPAEVPKEPPAQEKQAPQSDTPKIPPGKRLNV